MPEPTAASPMLYDFRLAHRQCQKIVLNAIIRADVNEKEFNEFSRMFLTPFEDILTAQRGDRRWRVHGEHVRSLARLLGSLAEFYALRDPKKPEVVGNKHLIWALKIMKAECALGLDEADETAKPDQSERRFIYCDVPV
jgi:hypothetical protein